MKKCYILMLVVSFCLSAYAQTQSIKVESGWNLMSLPLRVIDSTKSSLFPTAVSDAFIFQGIYISKDTLQNGFGFWLKFDSAQTISITGEIIYEDRVEVSTGWNMIGALTRPIAVNSIRTDIPGLIVSDFFGFTNGTYQSTDTLQPGFGYWVKVSQNGVIILSAVSAPCPGTPTVDYAEKTYNTVQIGSQCWLKENLDVGTMVAGVDTQKYDGVIEKYCYNNDTNYCRTYGGLYQWDEAMAYSTTPGIKGICPTGWHIPTRADFQILDKAVSGNANSLKAIGQGVDSGTGTNTSGFSALFAGFRDPTGSFAGTGSFSVAAFWSSNEYDADTVHFMYMMSNDSNIYFYTLQDIYGFSVRCLKNDINNSPPGIPLNPSPYNGEQHISTYVKLSWSCNDPDGDQLSYNVYLDTNDPPTTKISSNTVDTTIWKSVFKEGATYFWRVVANGNHGDSTMGPVWSFTTALTGIPCIGEPTVDYAGKTYNTVQIGTQCWLKENLDVGTMIAGADTQKNNGVIEKHCYNNNPNNCIMYGGLYQWKEAVQYSTAPGTKGICPTGWHIPASGEFQTLSTTVGGDANALKAIGLGTGTNTSGFSALTCPPKSDPRLNS
jgi:uncharacterized protein (TIGR02145 family)